ncbi:MAG TPA: ABC transporter permease [Longimicrobiales bacterium]
MRDVKHALRTLFRTPFVTGVAALSLALGIGANAAIFSLFDQLLRAPLPVREPEQLVNLGAPGPKSGSISCNNAGGCEYVFSYPMYRDLEREQTALAGLAAHRSFGANLAFQGQTLDGSGMLVSGSYFPVLGLRPALGRLLAPPDDEVVGGHYVAVLSHAYWQTRLGGDLNVLNQTIIVNGHPFTIVGVAPRGFRGTTVGVNPDVFVPLTMRAQVTPGFDGFENRRNYWVYVFGRLKPGVTLEQARAGLNAVYQPIIREVEAPLNRGMSEQTMARFLAREVTVEEGWRGQSSLHDEVRTPTLLLFATTIIVLLIACANIANLLLARGAGRSMEMAVRLSLGAGRARVVRQLLTESLVLAVLGGAASLLVARLTLTGIASIMPDAATALNLELRPGVVLFTAAVAIGTGILFGLFPALHSTRPELVSSMRASTGQVGGGRAAMRFRTSLVTAQIALSMALLISAGLFIRSLVNVSRVDLGLRTENVVTFAVSPELNGYEPARSRALFQRIETELAALPGVTGVAASAVPLLAGSNWSTDVSVQGFESGPDVDSNTRVNRVGPGFFRTLGIPLIAGREFDEGDVAGAEKVAIVNEAFAEKFGLGRGAVGAFMSDRGAGDPELDVRIVGLVQDAKYSEVKDDVPPQLFRPYAQDTTIGSMFFYARTSLPPDQLLRAIPRVVAQLDPNLPVEELKTLRQQVRENLVLDRLVSTLAAAFAALATLLAAVGLYGVLAYSVAQRTREFGLRMAIGADAARVRRLVLRQVARMLLVGAAAGIAAALVLGRYAESLLFEMEARDPLTFLAGAALLSIVVFGAGLVPAVRAARVDPMQALRYE